VILYRCFAWKAGPSTGSGRTADAPDGPLWFPRVFQGEGRHDNPDRYGCLYLSDRAVSCIVEQFAAFRGQRLIASLLRRRGLPLALARIELDDDRELIDLDDPAVLRRERLRPSQVATRRREITQPQAAALFTRHRGAAGLRWWSAWEATWTNVTMFDRAANALRLLEVSELSLDHPGVLEAAEVFGLRVA
jgi:RES domain-containing protein